MVSDMAQGAMEKRLLDSIEEKKRELDRFRPLPRAVAQKLEEQFSLEWIYNSNAIEGNTLTLRETEIVLNRGLTIGNKTLREHFEVINHKEGIRRLEEFVEKKRELSEEFIRGMHAAILKSIDDREAGNYRTTSVRILGAAHIPPNPIKIPALMKEFMAEYHENKKTIPVPELAAWLHYRFVCIHPFIDGNGRTSRLLMNLALMQNGYPAAIILNVDRKKYYEALRRADLDKPNDFFNFIGRAIERSLMIYLNSIQPQDHITLKEAAKYCDYSMEYLSLLARKGELPAVKFQRNWMTTREAIENYASRQREG
jgi:Fic family protein